MSRATVGLVIEKLLTDEVLRLQFALDRVDAVATLCLGGFELEQEEIDLFCRTDPETWFLDHAGAGQWQQ